MPSKAEIWSVALQIIDDKVGHENRDRILSAMPSMSEDFKTLSSIYQRFCISAQNRSMVSAVIGWIEEHADMQEALAHFDISVTGAWTEEEFYSRLTQQTQRGRQADLTRPRNLWRQFAHSLFDITCFMKEFVEPNGAATNFRDYVEENCSTKEGAWEIANAISGRIRGMGPVLVCDALKETGFTNYSKPDTHIKDIFERLGLSERDDQSVFYSVWGFAESVNALPCQVDKIFWLIGSGKFYMLNLTLGPLEEEFFDRINLLND